MRETRPVTAPSARAHTVVGAIVLGGAVGTLIAGRLAFSIFVGLVLFGAYIDLRRLLGDAGHPTTLVLGAAGVGGFLWCGYIGELSRLPSVAAVLMLALLVTRIVLHEAGSRSTEVTADLAATLGAAGVVGILGAHILLIRAVPRFGLRGIVVFGCMALANEVAAFTIGRWRGRHPLNRLVAPQKTWEGLAAAVAVSLVVGLVAGFLADPPFEPGSGLAFGLAVGIAVPLGDLGFSTVKRSAGVRRSGEYLGAAGGALDVVNGVVFAAPVFYWAFRTIAL